ncbi:MAG TPA: hypothetical protein VGN08_12845 [Solirubrobacteraceae bacterium]
MTGLERAHPSTGSGTRRDRIAKAIPGTKGRGSPDRIDLLQWAARMGAVTAEALAVRRRSSLAAARARLLAAERDLQLTRRRLLAGEPVLFAITRAGLRDCGLSGLEPCRISVTNAPHAIACVRAAAALEVCFPDHRVTGERELRRDERLAGVPLASARLGTTPEGTPLLHRPDLVLWPAGPRGRPVAIEVELTTKSPRRLAQICQAWARCRSVDGVIYLAAPDVVAPLNRAIAKVSSSAAIVVLPLGAVDGSLQLDERTVPGNA